MDLKSKRSSNSIHWRSVAGNYRKSNRGAGKRKGRKRIHERAYVLTYYYRERLPADMSQMMLDVLSEFRFLNALYETPDMIVDIRYVYTHIYLASISIRIS